MLSRDCRRPDRWDYRLRSAKVGGVSRPWRRVLFLATLAFLAAVAAPPAQPLLTTLQPGGGAITCAAGAGVGTGTAQSARAPVGGPIDHPGPGAGVPGGGRLRSRRPHQATSPAEAAAVVELAIQRYVGANHTRCTELLGEREGNDLSRPTVRRILTKAGIGSPSSRRSPQHRFRRPRMPQAEMLVRLDGSHHAWLGDRGPQFALLLAVDDATGAVDSAVFHTGEDTRDCFMFLESWIQWWGMPLGLYSDRHAVFRHNARQLETAAEATRFTREATRFTRGLQELGIRQVCARWSPGPKRKRIVSDVRDHHISRLQQRHLAALEPVRIDEAAVNTAAGKDVVSEATITWGRTPTPAQLARWKAIQRARRKWLSLRAISRELGISRVTVRKYACAEQPPTKKLSAVEWDKLKALRKSTTVANWPKGRCRCPFNTTESLDNNTSRPVVRPGERFSRATFFKSGVLNHVR